MMATNNTLSLSLAERFRFRTYFLTEHSVSWFPTVLVQRMIHYGPRSIGQRITV